ncbi:MAG: tetratricopeptide repeat protein [Candidatus Magnetomorum sp.]|nr:tetratricopeptide repeat protein [Candidatus Magnetomorum sp.]
MDADIQHLFHQAMTFADQQNYETAANCFETIITQDPARLDALINLGLMHYYAGHYEQAEQCMRSGLSKMPTSPDVYFNLGLICSAANKPAEAMDCYQKSIAYDSSNAHAWYNLGDLYFHQKQYKPAIQCFKKAISLKDDFHDAHLNLGESYSRMGQYQKAIKCFNRLISLHPNHKDAFYNLGVAYNGQRQYQDAINAYDHALAIDPNHVKSHYNKSFILLLLGDFVNGFLEYEWRLNKQETYRSSSQMPFWKGTSSENKTLLVYAEQGFGDCIQFVRFLPMIHKKVKSILLECQPELVRLFTGFQGIDTIIQRGDPLPEHDYQVSLLSLGYILNITRDRLPSDIPYLNPLKKESQVSDIIALHNKKIKAGIVWGGTGSTEMKTDMGRSLQLKECAVLLDMPDIQWFSFQKGARTRELHQSPGEKLIDLGTYCSDFFDTAIAACQMDVIITVDTAMAHLAGALGLNVWTLLSFDADWRWLQATDQSPWYPSMKLFRQDKPKNWEKVLYRVKNKLHETLNNRPVITNPLSETPGPLQKENNAMKHQNELSFQEAVQYFQQHNIEKVKECIIPLLKKNPEDAVSWNLFGMIAAKENHIHLAIQCLKKACALFPEKALFYFNLADAYRQGKFLSLAIETYQKALKYSPEDQSVAIHYGMALKEKGHYDQALKVFQQLLETNPDHIQSYINMGTIFREMGLYSPAMIYYEKALQLKPDDAEAQRNRSLLLLVQGDLKNGFDAYEFRWMADGVQVKRNLKPPQWDGTDLTDRHIFVWGEQGMGDELLFASMFPDLLQKAGQVSIECAPGLLPLFIRSFPQAVVVPSCKDSARDPHLFPEADCHRPAGSLFRFLRTSPDQFPQHNGYLKADEKKVKMLCEQYLNANHLLKVGISWAGDRDNDHPAQLESWKPILSCPNIQFFNLQYGDCQEEIDRIQEQLNISIFNDPDIDPLKSIDDQAAQIQVMDLVISIGNTTAQLAGALGKPVWVLLPVSSDWHWFSNRTDSPWFPSMRLFRQPQLGDWESVIQQVAEALKKVKECKLESPIFR